MVAATPNTIRLGSDEDSSKRRQILDGARKVFMDLGFDGASMDEIARSAASPRARSMSTSPTRTGCSRPSSRRKRSNRARSRSISIPARDAETTLREFGQAYIGSLCRPGGGSSIRTVMAIAERMPEVGRRFYENVLEKTINRLADYLQAHVGPDDLAIDDCGLAASQFMKMCQATLFLPFVFQAAPAPSAERIAQVVDSATRMFLAAYRAKPA